MNDDCWVIVDFDEILKVDICADCSTVDEVKVEGSMSFFVEWDDFVLERV